jgi:hypothetical protein
METLDLGLIGPGGVDCGSPSNDRLTKRREGWAWPNGRKDPMINRAVLEIPKWSGYESWSIGFKWHHSVPPGSTPGKVAAC